MILLSDNCIVFETASGESVPHTAESISVEVLGDAANLFDHEFIKHAAAAVFHYYRDELGRETVSVAEFSLSLEKVLRGFKLTLQEPLSPAPRVIQSDLRLLAPQSDAGCELLFFPRLREELQALLRQQARRCFASRACANASSNSPARNAGPAAARICRIRSSNSSAPACPAKTAAPVARWW